jgi:hypothetical protein
LMHRTSVMLGTCVFSFTEALQALFFCDLVDTSLHRYAGLSHRLLVCV